MKHFVDVYDVLQRVLADHDIKMISILIDNVGNIVTHEGDFVFGIREIFPNVARTECDALLIDIDREDGGRTAFHGIDRKRAMPTAEIQDLQGREIDRLTHAPPEFGDTAGLPLEIGAIASRRQSLVRLPRKTGQGPWLEIR